MSAKVMTRVLVLHGYSQNGYIFSKRLSALRKEGKDIDFVFVNAPYTLLPSDMFAPRPDVQGPGANEGPTPEQIQSDPKTALCGWWKHESDRPEAVEGLTESVAFLRDVLKESTFDGVFGFSQGAALAALLAAMLERPTLYPPFLVDGKPPHPPLSLTHCLSTSLLKYSRRTYWKFCIAASAFKPTDAFFEPFFSPPYSTPTLHIIGKTDTVVPPERARQLVAVSSGARVAEHEGGHFVPSKGPWRKFLVKYMKDPLGDYPAPPLVADDAAAESVPASVQPSGANTPIPGEQSSVLAASAGN